MIKICMDSDDNDRDMIMKLREDLCKEYLLKNE